MKRSATFFALLAVPTLGAADPAVTETRCNFTAFDGVNAETLQTIEVPGFSVLEATTNSEAFRLPPGLPANIIDVMCGRSSAVFAPNDFKVALTGLRLFITSVPPDGERRTLGLTFSEGRFAYFMTQGHLSDDERRAIQARLDEFHDAIQPR